MTDQSGARADFPTSSGEAFRAFVEFAPDAIVMIDRTGRIVLVNSGTESMFGFGRDDLLGQQVEMLLPDRYHGAHAGHRTRYLGEPNSRPMGADLDLYGRRKDGTEFPVDISLAPLETENGLFIAAAIRDVTERKKAETLRDEFIRNAAHELRTPLAALLGLSETLALHIHDLREDQVTEILAALRRQGERASTLVANLLDLSRLEGGRVEVELCPVDLEPAVTHSIEVAPAPQGYHVSSKIPAGITVTADQIRLEQVVTNLLTNAYRYGGTEITIDASSTDDGVVLRVADDGQGAPDELIPTLFDPFTRGRTAGQVGGSGIGLALCRRIVEAFGGTLRYDHAEPHGARFTVRLRKG